MLEAVLRNTNELAAKSNIAHKRALEAELEIQALRLELQAQRLENEQLKKDINDKDDDLLEVEAISNERQRQIEELTQTNAENQKLINDMYSDDNRERNEAMYNMVAQATLEALKKFDTSMSKITTNTATYVASQSTPISEIKTLLMEGLKEIRIVKEKTLSLPDSTGSRRFCRRINCRWDETERR